MNNLTALIASLRHPKDPRKANRMKKAFTLVEVLLVVLIIGLLFVLIMTKLNFTTDRARLAGVQDDFEAWRNSCELTAQEHTGFEVLVDSSDAAHPDYSKLVEALNKNLDNDYKLYIVSVDDDGYGRKKGEIASDKKDPWGTYYHIEYRHVTGVTGSNSWKLDDGVLIFTSENADLVYKTDDDYVMVCGYEANSEGFGINTDLDCYLYANCDHNWTWTSVRAPKCEESGLDKGVCSGCGAEKYRYIAPLGHLKGATPAQHNAPTCEATGSDIYKCTRCGKEFAEILPATGHTPVDVGRVEPTCTTAGHTESSQCSVCGKILLGETLLPALGHKFDTPPTIVQATCLVPGSITGVCSRCGLTIVDPIPATGHNMGEWIRDIEPAIGVEGHEYRVCMNPGCTYKEERTLDALEDPHPHEHSYTWTRAVEPLCLTPGLELGTCSCGDMQTRDIPALGHDMTDWYLVKAPTMSEEGEEARDCRRCGLHETRKLPIVAHTHDYNWVQTKAPTCTEYGEETGTCACGDTKTKPVNPLGHNEGTVWEYNTTIHWHVCSRCGVHLSENAHVMDSGTVTVPATETSEGVKTYKCTICAYSRTEPIPKADHVHTLGTPTRENEVAPTCTGKGSYDMVTRCTSCSAVISRQTYPIDALGHNWGSYVSTDQNEHWQVCSRCSATQNRAAHTWNLTGKTDPTCTNDGTNNYKCPTCGRTKTETVDKLGHQWNAHWEYDNSATGYHWHECDRCGATDTATKAVHTLVWIITKEATVTTTGLKHQECTVCDYTGPDVTIPKSTCTSHVWDAGVVTTQPHCESKGIKTFTCTLCGATKTEDIAALGHQMDGGKVTTKASATATGVNTNSCTRTCSDGWSCTYSTTTTIPKWTVALTTSSDVSKIYTGSQIKPAVTVKHNGTTVASSRYNVTYSNNINIGTATITVTMSTADTTLTGSANVTFNIVAGSRTITVDNPVPLQTYETKTLVDIHYSIDHPVTGDVIKVVSADPTIVKVDSTTNNITGVSVGTTTITITVTPPSGSNYGPATKTITINVTKQDLPDDPVEPGDTDYNKPWHVVIKPLDDVPYDGQSHMPAVEVKCNGITVPTSEYTVHAGNTVDANNAVAVYVTANSTSKTIEGETVAYFKIIKRDVKISNYANQTLIVGGTATLSPIRKVADDNTDLVKGLSTVALPGWSYSSNASTVATVDSNGKITAVGVGTATITITSNASTNYNSKSVTLTVTVQAASISGASITFDQTSYPYDGTERRPTPIVKLGGKTLVLNTDYTIDGYSNNKLPGTATVTIRGKGSYSTTDTASGSFTITTIPLSSATIVVNPTSYSFDGLAKTPDIYVFVISSDGTYATLIWNKSSTYGTTKSGTTTTSLESLMSGKTIQIETDLTNYQTINHYNVTYSNNVNAGTTATATLTAVNNSIFSSGSSSKPFSITKVTPAIIVENPATGTPIYSLNMEVGSSFHPNLYLAIKVNGKYYVGTNSAGTALVTYEDRNTSGTKFFTSGKITASTTSGAQTKLSTSAFLIAAGSRIPVSAAVGKITAIGIGSEGLKFTAAASTNFNQATKILKYAGTNGASSTETTAVTPIDITPTTKWVVRYIGQPKQLTYVATTHKGQPVYIDKTELSVTYEDGTPVDPSYYTIDATSYVSNDRIGTATVNVTAVTGAPITGTKNVSFTIEGDVYLELGSTFNNHIATKAGNKTYVKNVVIGTYSAYQDIVGVAYTTGLDVSQAQDGSIRLFYKTNTLYLLKQDGVKTIHANVNASSMFNGLSALTQLNLDVIDFSETTNISNMFYGCTVLTNGDVLANVDLGNVTTVQSLFYNCKALNHVVFGSKYANPFSKVTSMACMFYGCTSLNDIDMSNWQTNAVTTMQYMFYNCTALKEISLPNMDNVTDVKYMFQNDTNLIWIILPSTPKVTAANYMFSGCTKLKWVDIGHFGSSISASVNVAYIFNGDTALEFVFADSNPNVMNCLQIFQNATNLRGGNGTKNTNNNYNSYTYFRIDEDGTKGLLTNRDATLKKGTDFRAQLNSALSSFAANYRVVFGRWDNEGDNHGLKDWYSPDSSVTANGCGPAVDIADGLVRAYACREGSGYVIYILSHPRIVNVFANADCSYMFATNASYGGGAQKITAYPEWSFVNFNAVGKATTTMSHIFDGSLIYTPQVPMNADSLVDISYAYTNSPYVLNVNSFNIPNSVTNISGLFDNCDGLVTADISNWNTSKVTNMMGVFRNCSSLTTFKSSGGRLDTKNVTDFSYFFYHATATTTEKSKLASIDLGGFNTSKTTTFAGMFQNCESLTELDMSSFSNTSLTTISNMFNGCKNLVHIYVQNWDSSKVGKFTGNNTFTGCVKLTGGVTVFNSSYTNYKRALLDQWVGKTYEETSVSTHAGYFYQKAYANGIILETGPEFNAHAKALAGGNQIKTVMFGKSSALSVYAHTTFASMTTYVDAAHTGAIRMYYSGNTIYVAIADTSSKIVFNSNCSEMFWNMSISSITFEYCDLQEVTDMSDMFRGNNASTLSINGTVGNTLTTSKLLNTSGMFAGGAGYVNSTFVNKFVGATWFDTSKVTNMSYMFANVSSSSTAPLVLTGLETGSVTDTRGMFADVSDMIGGRGEGTLDLSAQDFSKVTTAVDMFSSYAVGGFSTIKFKAGMVMSNLEYADRMFRGCNNLTSIDTSFLNGNGKLRTASEMFADCAKISGISLTFLPGMNNSLTDMSYMFSNCTNIGTILTSWTDSKGNDLFSMTFNGYTGAALLHADGMFQNCSNIKNLDLRGFVINTNLTSEAMFNGCTKLKHIWVSKNVGSFAKNTTSMFQGCENLTGSMDTHYKNDNSLSGFNAKANITGLYGHIDYGMTNPGYLYCPDAGNPALLLPGPEFNVKVRQLSGWKTVTAFKFVAMDNVGTSGATWPTVEGTTAGSYQKVDLANTGTIRAYISGQTLYIVLGTGNGQAIYAEADCSYMFAGFEKLYSVTGTNWGALNMTGIDKLANVTRDTARVNSNLTGDNYTINGDIHKYQGDRANFHYDGVNDVSYMFAGCAALNDVTMTPSNCNLTKAWALEGMFKNDSLLKSVTLPYGATDGVDGINTARLKYKIDKTNTLAYMFYGCKALNSLTNEEFIDMGAFEQVAYMFYDCEQITRISLFNQQDAYCGNNMYNPVYMFYNCKALKVLELGKYYSTAISFTVDGVVYDKTEAVEHGIAMNPRGQATGMFEGCSGLKMLNLTNIQFGITIASNLFKDCAALQEIVFASSNASFFDGCTDMTSLFEGCSNLTKLTNWGSLQGNGGAALAAANMFSGCHALRTIDLSNFKTGTLLSYASMFGNRASDETLSVKVNLASGMQLTVSGTGNAALIDFSNKYCDNKTVAYNASTNVYSITP